MNVQTRVEGPRGCGFRSPGGLYLVSGLPGGPCGKLPIPLNVCPCCGAGIKPARGWTWITSALFEGHPCQSEEDCQTVPVCPLYVPPDRMGLIWVGEKYYSTPGEFTREANAMGVCRRIPAVPKDFVLGETWVALAHRKAMTTIGDTGDPEPMAGIFSVFLPQRIEYVVKDDDSQEDLERMEKRGITLVKIQKKEKQLNIDNHDTDPED